MQLIISSNIYEMMILCKYNLIIEVITTKIPDEVGFGHRKNWNANIAGKWVSDNFNVEYSNRGMLQVLHRLNLSYTRPTYVTTFC